MHMNGVARAWKEGELTFICLCNIFYLKFLLNVTIIQFASD